MMKQPLKVVISWLRQSFIFTLKWDNCMMHRRKNKFRSHFNTESWSLISHFIYYFFFFTSLDNIPIYFEVECLSYHTPIWQTLTFCGIDNRGNFPKNRIHLFTTKKSWLRRFSFDWKDAPPKKKLTSTKHVRQPL